MKKILISFLVGVISGALSVYYFAVHKDMQTDDQVIVKQISGEKITHDNFDFGGSNITFKTESEGKGEIETSIPKSLIPEAYDWMNRVHSVTFSIGYKSDNDKQSIYYGVMYGYRMGRITLGGGIDFASDLFGLKVSAGYVW